MAYNKFTLDKVKREFQLTIEENTSLFPNPKPQPISDLLHQILARDMPLATAINTEKARSEMIVAPVLIELKSQLDISLFSGIEFNVDRKRGLSGRCDFLISLSQEQYYLTTPIISVVEAKNDNLKQGLGQCIATMIASQIFNQQKEHPLPTIYGVVTTGSLWQFLTLSENTVSIDRDEYHIHQIESILGILKQICQQAV